MTQESDRNQCIHWRLQKYFQGGNVTILLMVFRLLTMQWKWNGRSQNAFSFLSISLCWLNLNSQSFVSNVFYTSAIRNAYSVHKLPNIHFFEHFLQLSHNFGQNNMRSEKTKKLGTLAKLFQAMISICWQDYRTTYCSYNTTQALK